MTLKDLVTALRSSYCGSIGLEYTHVQDIKQVMMMMLMLLLLLLLLLLTNPKANWFRDRFEKPQPPWTHFTKQVLPNPKP